MWKLQSKLKILSKKLSDWSREDIGDVNEHVLKQEKKVQEKEKMDSLTNIDQGRIEFNKVHAEYIKWLGMQES